MTRKLLAKIEVWAEVDDNGRVQELGSDGWRGEVPPDVSKVDLMKAVMDAVSEALGGKFLWDEEAIAKARTSEDL